MTTLGWIIMIVSITGVTSLMLWCFYRVLTLPEAHMQAPLEIDTRDRETDCR